jgi:prophage DNA circulation protein
MAWKDNLQDASFRGVKFDMVKVDDAAEFSLVKHSYPYSNGADIEQMGREARAISVEAVFYGDDYETQLENFTDRLDGVAPVLAAFDDSFKVDPLGGWLVHPVFGTMFVQVGKYVIRHDAGSVDEASVSIDFVESTPSKPFFELQDTTQQAEAIGQQGAAAVAAASEAAGAVIDRVRAANPLASLESLRSALTAPLLGLADKTNLVLSGLDVLAYPRAWGNDISTLVNGILDVRDWGEQLQADWASIQSDLNAFSIFSSQPSPVPPQVTSDAVPTEAQAVAVAATSIQINVAVGLANAASFVLASEAATPTLTPGEIEAISNTARSAIDSAIAQVRITYGIEQSRTIIDPLKDQALALQEAARAIIAVRPPLIQRTVEAPGNMRLLAHLWYGDSDRAPELYRLNSARDPFVRAGEVLNAYAR